MRTVNVRVIPGAKRTSVTREGDLLRVRLTAPAVDGKANKALVDVLADYFKVRKSRLEIIKGLKSRVKTISINDVVTYGRAKHGT